MAALTLHHTAALNTTTSQHIRGINVNVRSVSSGEQKTVTGTEPLDGTVTRRTALPVSQHAWRNAAIFRL